MKESYEYMGTMSPSWPSQFGLYKYEDATNKKLVNKNRVGIYGICGMIIILVFVLFVVVHDFGESPELVKQTSESLRDSILYSDYDYNKTMEDEIDENDKMPIESMHDVNDTLDIAPASKESKDSVVSVEAQKLVFLPSRELKPPKMKIKRRRPIRRQMSYYTGSPHPFDFQMNGPPPHSFTKPSTGLAHRIPKDYKGKVNNIQDILHQIHHDDSMWKVPLERKRAMLLKGAYRRPKVSLITDKDFAEILGSKPKVSKSFTAPYMTDYVSDPFFNYKPKSPSEINSLAANEKFSLYSSAHGQLEKFAPPNFQYAPNLPFKPLPTEINDFVDEESGEDVSNDSDFTEMYLKMMEAEGNHMQSQLMRRQKQKKGTNKPFSVMLDVFPVPEASMKFPYQFYRPNYQPDKSRMNPAYNGDSWLQGSYFNHINFPQVQKNPQANQFYNNMYFRNLDMYGQKSGMGQDSMDENGEEKPSSLVVHLNLFPKKKKKRGNSRSMINGIEAEDRASIEEEENHKNDTSVEVQSEPPADHVISIPSLNMNLNKGETAPTTLPTEASNHAYFKNYQNHNLMGPLLRKSQAKNVKIFKPMPIPLSGAMPPLPRMNVHNKYQEYTLSPPPPPPHENEQTTTLKLPNVYNSFRPTASIQTNFENFHRFPPISNDDFGDLMGVASDKIESTEITTQTISA
jgi:hypothetical protein